MAALVNLNKENTAIRGPLKVRESGEKGRWKDRCVGWETPPHPLFLPPPHPPPTPNATRASACAHCYDRIQAVAKEKARAGPPASFDPPRTTSPPGA